MVIGCPWLGMDASSGDPVPARWGVRGGNGAASLLKMPPQIFCRICQMGEHGAANNTGFSHQLQIDGIVNFSL